eukprot:1921541-Pleurochrysis_carterae.AAC.2
MPMRKPMKAFVEKSCTAASLAYVQCDFISHSTAVEKKSGKQFFARAALSMRFSISKRLETSCRLCSLNDMCAMLLKWAQRAIQTRDRRTPDEIGVQKLMRPCAWPLQPG